MRIALMRTGTVLFADAHKASPLAGNQDALGLLRYLKDSEHEVCVFGMTKGDLGVTTFNVDMSGLDDMDSGEAFHERADAAIEQLRGWNPEVCLNVAGGAPTISDPNNPYGVLTQMWATRTVFPCLKACHVLDLPRVVVLNDPRNHPKDHEMHYWPRAMPAAVLSQRDYDFMRIVRGKGQRFVERYGRCENWWSYGTVPADPLDGDRQATVVMAHAHFGDGRIDRGGRVDAWRDVLASYRGNCPLLIYGKDWDGWEDRGWQGVVKHDEVQGILRRSVGGPMMSIQPNFATGKLREYVLAGCTPRPIVGAGFTYDEQERYVKLDDVHRVGIGEEWHAMHSPDWVRELQEKTTPDFSALEDCLAYGCKGWGGVTWR